MARFHYERGIKDFLFLLLIRLGFKRAKINKTKNALFYACSENESFLLKRFVAIVSYHYVSDCFVASQL